VLSERFDTCIEYEFVKVPGHSNNPYNEKADRLANSALAGERKLIEGANSFIVPNFSDSDLETIISLIKEELPELKEDRKEILGGKQIKLGTGKKNSVTIKFYNSNKLLVQSKPNAIYQIVLTYISELLGEKNVVKLVKQAYRIKINSDSLEANYANLCANIPANYNNSIKTLLRQAIINLNGYFEAEEYGQYAYPALRALEGHMKYLFNKNGIHVEKSFTQFNGNEIDGYVLTASIQEPDITNLESCYNYYVKTRHKIFHFGDIIGCTDNTY
jgi:ribonuclease HI